MADTTSKPPEIPSLSSATPIEVRRAFDAVRGWFVQLARLGGVTVNPPADVRYHSYVSTHTLTGLVVTYTAGGVVLQWDVTRRTDYAYAEIWQSDSDNLGTAVLIGTAIPNTYTDTRPLAYPGTTFYYWIRPVNLSGAAGAYNATDGTTDAVLVPPHDVLGFAATPYKGAINLTWWPNTDADLAGYEIRLGESWAGGTVLTTRAAGTRFSWQPVASGTQQFWIAAVDVAGNYSAVPATSILSVSAPLVSDLNQQVVDNNVLLSWSMTAGTYPVDHVEIRKGTDYATAAVVGTLSGTFTALFETQAGTYKYWVTAINTAGLSSDPVGVYAVVNQPPDYMLYTQYNLAWSGTKTSCMNDGMTLYGPIPVQTWEQHFTSRGWDQPQDQIDTGLPYFIQPAGTTGSYVEIIDYGTTIPSTRISLAITKTAVVGTVVITPKLEFSATGAFAGEQQVFTGSYEAYGTAFRYVRVTLNFATSDGGVVAINPAIVQMDVKLKNVQGTVTAVSTDSGGTLVDITGSFIDVQSISLTPNSSSPVYAVYDFVDTPFPTSFKVLAFNSSGVRTTVTVSYTVRGV